MTLLDGKVGNFYIVDNIQLVRAVEGRLEALGLTKGTKVQVMNRKRNGAVIFKVRGTRLAIGKEIANAITIQG